MINNTIVTDPIEVDIEPSSMLIQKWGGVASLVAAAGFVIAHYIYLTGNLDEALGPATYSLADVLYGPVWGAGLVAATYALRERIGERAPRLMTMALLVAVAAAGAFVTVAAVRSANRYYHLAHPELQLQEMSTILIVWATLVAGLIGAAWQFLGWTFVLIGAAGWVSQRLPRALSALYLAGGAAALAVLVFPGMEGFALVAALAICIWQGIVLWRTA